MHGSFDWFWEFAGLGAPAFALLGLACALAPARERTDQPPRARLTRARLRVHRAALLAGAVVLALGAAYSLGAPWLGELQLQEAAKIWPRAPRKAYSRLHDAASLNPLSDEPYLLAGTIALRFGDLARADREFAQALKRTPGDAYATLERGAIASSRGDRAVALALLRRTVSLTPREPLAREALDVVRSGRQLDVAELNRAILLKAQQLS